MSHLTLNNVVVPTADPGGSKQLIELGDRAPMVDGTLAVDIRTRRRQWSYVTKPMPPLRAQGLRGLIQGLGIYLPCDASSFASSAGQTPLQANAIFRPNVAPVSPYNVLDQNGVSEAKCGAGSLTVQRAVTNQLTAAQAECNSTTPFSTWGTATQSVVTSQYLSGGSCIRVVATGAGGGIIANNAGGSGNTIAANAGDTIYLSAYVSGIAGNTVRLYLVDSQHSTTLVNGPTCTIPSSGWIRTVLSFTLVSSSTDLRWEIGSLSPTAQTFFVDCIQFETVTSGHSTQLYAGSWTTGGNTVGAGNLQYSGPGLMGPNGATFNAWATRPPGLQSECLLGLTLNSDTGYHFLIYSPVGATSIEVDSVGRNSTSFGTMAFPFTWDNSWHMITAVLCLSPTGGDANLYLYVDAALKGSATLASKYLPTPSYTATLDVGHIFGTDWWGGRIDEALCLPYPVDQNFVTGLYGLPTWNNSAYPPSVATPGAGYNTVTFPDGQYAGVPYLWASGLGVDSVSASVIGQVTRETFAEYYDGSTWRDNGVVMEFTLTEA